MRKLFFFGLALLLLVFHFPGYSQIKNNRAAFYPPVFLDTVRLKKEILLYTDIRSVLAYQRDEGMPAEYVYGFLILCNGKVKSIISDIDHSDLYSSLTKFALKHFNEYKWKMDYAHGKSSSKIAAYGNLTISFITIENRVILDIMLFNGALGSEMRSKRVYYSSLKL